MRVAYVSTDTGIAPFGRKGASVHIQAILREFLERGDDVHLLTPRPGEPSATLDDVGIHALDRAHGEGVAEREASVRRAERQVGPVLDRLHDERPIDLVYERYALWGRTATSWAERHGVPSVLEVNSPLPQEQARHRQLAGRDAAQRVARLATSRASVVVCVSEQVAEWVRGVGSVAPECVHVVPNGVDTRRFEPAVVRRRPTTFTLGFVGTLKPWHGVDDLVRALALLQETEGSYRLLIVGDGPQLDDVQALAASLRVTDCVTFTGAVDPDDVPGLLATVDVAIAPYPALDDFYFSPLKVYEYLAAGLPVVASDLPGLREVLGSGPAPLGLLYPAGSVEQLATTVGRLRRDPVRRAALARRARQAVVEHHDWKLVLDRILQLSGVPHVTSQAS